MKKDSLFLRKIGIALFIAAVCAYGQFFISTSLYFNFSSTLKSVFDFSIFAFPIILTQYILRRFIDREIKESQLTFLGWLTSTINLAFLILFLMYLYDGRFQIGSYSSIVVTITLAYFVSWVSAFLIKKAILTAIDEQDDLIDSDFTR
ncbi:MAG: hypothetical protein JXQ87_16880 [Bacteroidia bacterium]